MAGRSISRFALVAFAASALLGACVKQVDEQAAAAPPPPPPPEQPALAGAPTDATPATPAQAPSDATAADAAATEAQANDDAYIASLPAGLMAVHKYDAATGRTILVISNYPIANPALRARIWHARHHSILNGGPLDKGTPSITTASAAPATTAQPTPSATPAPPTVAEAAPVAHSPAPATQTAGFKGVTLSPGMWLIGGIALLAIVILVMLAGRKPQRREPLRA